MLSYMRALGLCSRFNNCSQHLERSLAVATAQPSRAASEATASSQQQSLESQNPGSAQPDTSTSTTGVSGRIYVACVLERLPVIAPMPPNWEADFKAWEKSAELRQGYLKEYSDVAALLRPQEKGDGAPKHNSPISQTQQFDPVPSITKADTSGFMRTMRRKLDSRLYLLVKQQLEASASQWQFPYAQHQGDESIRQTCERALSSTFGRKYPVYHIGNAPMAHLPLQNVDGSGEGSIFFMLAQAVDDPWDELSLIPDCAAKDWMWVTLEEATSNYLGDQHLSKLVRRMLN